MQPLLISFGDYAQGTYHFDRSNNYGRRRFRRLLRSVDASERILRLKINRSKFASAAGMRPRGHSTTYVLYACVLHTRYYRTDLKIRFGRWCPVIGTKQYTLTVPDRRQRDARYYLGIITANWNSA